MRRMLSFISVSTDGYHEGPSRELDWHNVDAEFNEFAVRQLDDADTLVFGRVTYEMMAAFWPTPAARVADPAVAERMNGLPKIVVSRSLDTAEWPGTRLVTERVEVMLGELKELPGKDMLILGSSTLTGFLLQAGLVDELRLMVNPIVLGGGNPVLDGVEERIGLELRRAQPFASGNVLLCYGTDTTSAGA